MASVISDIPFIELMLIVIMLFLASVGYQALIHKGDQITEEDSQAVIKWVIKGLIGLASLEVVLFLIASLVRT
jgi:hypothetical protein